MVASSWSKSEPNLTISPLLHTRSYNFIILLLTLIISAGVLQRGPAVPDELSRASEGGGCGGVQDQGQEHPHRAQSYQSSRER